MASSPTAIALSLVRWRSMTARLARLVVAAALCAGTAACANDTGRPKGQGSLGGDTDFGSGFGSAGASSPPPFVAPPMMTSATQPNVPVAPASCESARQAARGIVSDDCVACTCRLTPPGSNECDADCWRLLVCATTKCTPEDLNCLIAKCSPEVGGLSMLAIAGASARGMPFMDCAAFCIVDDHSEAGVTNDF